MAACQLREISIYIQKIYRSNNLPQSGSCLSVILVLSCGTANYIAMDYATHCQAGGQYIITSYALIDISILYHTQSPPILMSTPNTSTTVEQSSAFIHPTSIVHPSCNIGSSVHIGPWCHIGPNVSIGEGTNLISSVVIIGSTTLGKNCIIHPYAVLGGDPQDRKYVKSQREGENSSKGSLIIGNEVVIREHCTVNTGTRPNTSIGDRVWILANSHVAHDCQLEADVTIVNGAGVAGHVHIGRGATVAGLVGVHQWVRIGEMAFVGAGSMVVNDVLPYTTVIGDRAKVVGINTEGLKRAGWLERRIAKIQRAFDTFVRDGIKGVETMNDKDPDGDVARWIQHSRETKRGLCKPKYGLTAKL
jgi:UDP-N-acetylglucosamine acyltransferase